MKSKEILEGRNQPLIAVDIQDEYFGWSGPRSLIAKKMIEFANNQNGPILLFYNKQVEYGSLEDNDIKEYWEHLGFDPKNWRRVKIVPKGFGYLRKWMDNGVKDAVIIKTIREMYLQGVSNTSELYWNKKFGYDKNIFRQKQEELTKLTGNYYTHGSMKDISVNWTSIARLKEFNGAYIIGGLRTQCLREVTLLMNAFNIKYTLVNSLIYG